MDLSFTFDILAAVRRLEAAGLDAARQAEAIAEGMRDAAIADRDELATKGDFEAREGRLHRALWIQGAGIVAIHGGFIAIAVVLGLLRASLGRDHRARAPAMAFG